MNINQLKENNVEHVAICHGSDRTQIWKIEVIEKNPKLLDGYIYDYTTPSRCAVYNQAA